MLQAKHHQESQGSKKTTAAHYHWWQQRPLGGPKRWRVMKPFKTKVRWLFRYKFKSNVNEIEEFPWKWGVLGQKGKYEKVPKYESTSVFWHSRTGGSGRGRPLLLADSCGWCLSDLNFVKCPGLAAGSRFVCPADGGGWRRGWRSTVSDSSLEALAEIDGTVCLFFFVFFPENDTGESNF